MARGARRARVLAAAGLLALGALTPVPPVAAGAAEPAPERASAGASDENPDTGRGKDPDDGPAEEEGEEGAPRRLGLVERAGRRLAQLDISAVGPSELLARLGADDLRIKINRKKILDFRLDRLCDEPGGGRPGASGGAADAGPGGPAPSGPRANYVLYFDQTHLTLRGRLRAIDLARELVGELLRQGDRAMIVSSAREVTIYEPLTSDPSKLVDALRRLENDALQWDTWAEREQSRVGEVIHVLDDQTDVRGAMSLARLHQREEEWRADRAFRRLELTLGQLVDLDPPKALIVFSDTLRQNAGQHYLTFFGQSLREKTGLGVIDSSGGSTGLSFDRVVNEAAAQSIRIYGVQAEGLVGYFDQVPSMDGIAKADTMPTSSRDRVGAAQQTLRDLAGETGGHAFLNGVSAPRIAKRILDDSSCLFLASFDPEGFREDSPLRAKVETTLPGVTLRVRGRLVIQSDSRRETSRLLRAFGSPGTIEDPFEVTTHVIPTGYADGAYSVLLQFSVPGLPLHGTTWDLGLSVVGNERVHEESSGRLSLSGPGVPIIFEREVRLKPGSYEIVSVAHEASSGLIASDELDVTWPDPADRPAVVTALALLQPASGAFYREGQTRPSGSLARGPQHPVLADRPIGLVGLVCGSRRNRGELVVERSLVGESAVDFPPLSFDLRDGRCAQVRDLVPADTLLPGDYHYDMRLVQGGERLEGYSREFHVVEPGS